MRKIASLFLAALIMSIFTGAAFAAGTSAPYPVEVTEYAAGDNPRLNRVYALSADDDPAGIPTADFIRDGVTYTLLDMTRSDQTTTDTRPHTETVTAESTSRDMENILPLLAPTVDVNTQDGYSGTLTLDKAGIKVEAAGYGTSSRTVSAARSYPNLSDADISLIPKTTEDNGRTLELADVQWQEAGGFFHAVATYTGTITSKYPTGYTVTAQYTGEVSKTIRDTVLYTAVFGGTDARPREAEPAPINWNGLKWLVFPIGAAVVVLSLAAIRRFKAGRKGRYAA